MSTSTIPVATTRLDERAHRREDFVPGSAVELADGGIWLLRRPVLRFVPDHADELGFQVRMTLPGHDTYAELMERRGAILDAGDQVPVVKIAGVELAIGRLLLTANYDLTPEQVAGLLEFGYDEAADPAGARLREAVISVALGRGPRPQRDENNIP